LIIVVARAYGLKGFSDLLGDRHASSIGIAPARCGPQAPRRVPGAEAKVA